MRAEFKFAEFLGRLNLGHLEAGSWEPHPRIYSAYSLPVCFYLRSNSGRQSGHVIQGYVLVTSQDDEIFKLRLGYQNPVERIAVQ